MHDLVNREWPVYYRNGDTESYLAYYIGGYLLPSLLGKLFQSFEAAEISWFIYYTAAMVLIWINGISCLKISTKRWQMIFAVMLGFFSGGLWFAQRATEIFYPGLASVGDYHWFINSSGFLVQYRDFFTNLQWAPPQYIFPALILALWLPCRREVKGYVFYLTPMLLYGPFQFAVAVVMAVTNALVLLMQKEAKIKEIISIENIAAALSLGIVLVSYFWGNVSGTKPDSISLQAVSWGNNIGACMIFCFFMFGIYSVAVFPVKKKDPLYWSALVILSLLLFLRMGAWNDLCMCTSILPLFYLMLCILEYLAHGNHAGQRVWHKSIPMKKVFLMGYVFLCMYYPWKMYKDTVLANVDGKQGAYGWDTLETYADPTNETIPVDVRYNYYAYDIEGQLFYQYLARKRY